MFLIGIVALCLLFQGQILNTETDQHGGQETKPGGEMEDGLLCLLSFGVLKKHHSRKQM